MVHGGTMEQGATFEQFDTLKAKAMQQSVSRRAMTWKRYPCAFAALRRKLTGALHLGIWQVKMRSMNDISAG